MENPYQTPKSSATQRESSGSGNWKTYWIASYVFPYLTLALILILAGDQQTSGLTTIIWLFGPFALGIVGTLGALASSKLPLSNMILMFLATLIAYFAGFIVFIVLAIWTLGMVAS